LGEVIEMKTTCRACAANPVASNGLCVACLGEQGLRLPNRHGAKNMKGMLRIPGGLGHGAGPRNRTLRDVDRRIADQLKVIRS
jgi:hypothetical protein